MADRANLENYVTVRQAADLLGVSSQLVYDRVRAGDIVSLRFGDRYVIFKDDLDRKAFEIRRRGRKSRFWLGGVEPGDRVKNQRFSTSEEEDAWLKGIARDQGLSVAETVRQAINQAYGVPR